MIGSTLVAIGSRTLTVGKIYNNVEMSILEDRGHTTSHTNTKLPN